MVNIICPFCGEDDFDEVGLKGHLERYCEKYTSTMLPASMFAASPHPKVNKVETHGEPFEVECPKCLGVCNVQKLMAIGELAIVKKHGVCPRCQGRGTLKVVEVKEET